MEGLINNAKVKRGLTMDKQYELTMDILDEEYVDDLIVALARQGYAPYLSDEGSVCIEVDEIDLIELKGAK